MMTFVADKKEIAASLKGPENQAYYIFTPSLYPHDAKCTTTPTIDCCGGTQAETDAAKEDDLYHRSSRHMVK